MVQRESLRRSPVRHFLSDVPMAAGVEWRLLRIWAALVATLALGALMIASWIVAAIGLTALAALFIILRNISRDDPLARRKYLRYARQANAYEPWPQVRKTWLASLPGQRPFGFGRDRLM